MISSNKIRHMQGILLIKISANKKVFDFEKIFELYILTLIQQNLKINHKVLAS